MNYGVKIENVTSKDANAYGKISMGDAWVVMKQDDDSDCGILIENTENLEVTYCKVARLGKVRYWLIRLIILIPCKRRNWKL